jgi:urea transport system ATP-binding protein
MIVMDTRATSALLYLDGVHVSFDGFHAINNLSLTLAPGEMRAVIGPNGAGKTSPAAQSRMRAPYCSTVSPI